MIPLMKNAFSNEMETKKELSNFILKTQMLSMGSQCLEFEKRFSDFQGSRYSVLFNSGGSANLALIQSLINLGKLSIGAKVGLSALTWSTNVMPIIQLGLNPILIDCEKETLNVSVETLRRTNEKLNALFITNVLGFCGDLEGIQTYCRENDIILLEDNCESLGTEIKGKKTGSFGLGSTFSFFVAHHMSTIEGGMVCTDDEELFNMLKIVRANGWDRNLDAKTQREIRKKNAIESEFYAKYTFYHLGYNLRPTEITGFLGNLQLKFVEGNITKREQIYLELEQIIEDNPDLIAINRTDISRISAFALPIVCISKEKRDWYINQFSGAGIEIRPMIAGNISKQPFFKKLSDGNLDLPGADFLHQNSFYCGLYPELNLQDIETIKSCLIH